MLPYLCINADISTVKVETTAEVDDLTPTTRCQPPY